MLQPLLPGTLPLQWSHCPEEAAFKHCPFNYKKSLEALSKGTSLYHTAWVRAQNSVVLSQGRFLKDCTEPAWVDQGHGGELTLKAGQAWATVPTACCLCFWSRTHHQGPSCMESKGFSNVLMQLHRSGPILGRNRAVTYRELHLTHRTVRPRLPSCTA